MAEPGRPPPPQTTMGLLDYITAHSMDEDYAHVAEQRPTRRSADHRRARLHLGSVVALVVFGLLATTAGIQAARTEPVRQASRDSLVAQAQDRRTELDAAWLLTLRAARLLDRGERAAAQSSMAKLFASEACGRVVDRVLQVHGGIGYSRESTIERLYRDARVTRIYEGTSEVQRLVIAKSLL